MVKVRIPTPLRSLTGGKSEVDTQASDIQALIDSLNTQFPGLKNRICDDGGDIRRFVNIYLNEEDIRFMKGKDTPLKDGDEVSIIPAIAGGTEAKRTSRRSRGGRVKTRRAAAIQTPLCRDLAAKERAAGAGG